METKQGCNLPEAALAACTEDSTVVSKCLFACSGTVIIARVPDRHGSVLRCTPLGQSISKARAHRAPDGPKLVAPYRLSGKRGKNDAADAAAICEAVTRAQMRFVPIKSIEQQGQLMVHRARQGFVEQRTATINRIRGLLSQVRHRATTEGRRGAGRGNEVSGKPAWLDQHGDWEKY
jgi:hypothetical protein